MITLILCLQLFVSSLGYILISTRQTQGNDSILSLNSTRFMSFFIETNMDVYGKLHDITRTKFYSEFKIFTMINVYNMDAAYLGNEKVVLVTQNNDTSTLFYVFDLNGTITAGPSTFFLTAGTIYGQVKVIANKTDGFIMAFASTTFYYIRSYSTEGDLLYTTSNDLGIDAPFDFDLDLGPTGKIFFGYVYNSKFFRYRIYNDSLVSSGYISAHNYTRDYFYMVRVSCNGTHFAAAYLNEFSDYVVKYYTEDGNLIGSSSSSLPYYWYRAVSYAKFVGSNFIFAFQDPPFLFIFITSFSLVVDDEFYLTEMGSSKLPILEVVGTNIILGNLGVGLSYYMILSSSWPITSTVQISFLNCMDYNYRDDSCYLNCNGLSLTDSLGRYFCNCDPTSFYYAFNSSCLSHCSAPFTSVLSSPNEKFCNFPCNRTSYYYSLNRSCLLNCQNPFRSRNEDGYLYCDLCNSGFYHYQNSTCLPSCPSIYPLSSTPTYFTPRNISNYLYCDFACSEGNYYYPLNNSCSTSCSTTSPFTRRNQGGYLYCDFSCGAGSYFYALNSSCISLCPNTGIFSSRNVSNYLYCDFPCSQGSYYFDLNQSCLASCPSSYPFSSRNESGYLYCDFACSSGLYFYSYNGSCLSSCPTTSSFIPKNISGYLYCDFPCSLGQYYYPLNGSCAGYCLNTTPFSQRNLSNYLFCDFRCDSGQFYYAYNKSCSPICSNSNGFTSRNESNYIYCDFLCSQESYYYTKNNSCLSTCPTTGFFTPKNQSNYLHCDFPCDETQFYFSYNKSCSASCPSLYPFSSRNLSGYAYCDFECPEGQYFYSYNATCLPSCLISRSFIQINNSNYLFCDFPCPKGEFYFANNQSCSSSCQAGGFYSIKNDSSYLYCVYECQIPNYAYWNGTCANSCPSPLTKIQTSAEYICYNPCPDDFLYWNGTCMTSCDFPLQKVIEISAKYCKSPCTIGNYLYWNGTCRNSCSFPLRSKNESGYLFCMNDCKSGYLFWDGQCKDFCPLPLRAYNYSSDFYCENDCGNNFISWDGTCRSSCNHPYASIFNSSIKYCSNNTCSSSNYLYWNGSCLPYCNMLFNSSQEEISLKLYCNRPCPGSFLHEDGSCREECDFPLAIYENFGARFCNYICPTGYLHSNGSCLTSCDSPFQIGGEVGKLTCYSDCVNGYLYENGSCFSSCLAPYTIQMNNPYKLCINTCSQPFIVYDDSGGKCSECLNNTHCSAEFPICKLTFGSCLSCIRELNCSYTPNVTVQALNFGIFLIEFDLNMNNTMKDVMNYVKISLSISNESAYNLTYTSLSLMTYGVQVVPVYKMPAQKITFNFSFPELFRSFENIPMNYSVFELPLMKLDIICSDYCISCNRAFTCDVCNSSYTVVNNTCKKIIRYPPSLEVTQSYLSPNVILLKFSDFMNMTLDDLSNVTVIDFGNSDLNVTYYLEKIDDLIYKINILNADDIPTQSLVIKFTNTSKLRSINGLTLVSPQTSVDIQAIPALESLRTIRKTVNYLGQGTSAFYILTLNPTLLWLIMNNLQGYYYLMFYNVELPYNVKSIMSIFKIARFNFISNDMLGLDLQMNVTDIPSPQKFTDQDINGYYLKSAIGPIYAMLALWFLFIFLFTLNHFFRNIPRIIRAPLGRIIRMFQDSFFLNMWIGFYLDQTIMAILQLMIISFDAKDNGLSLTLAFMAYAINIHLIFFIRKYSRSRYDDREGNMVTKLVADFRKPQRVIFVLELIKNFAIGNVIVMFYNYPMIQIWLNAGLYLAFAAICIKTRPKADKLKNFMYILNDIMLFFASMMIFIIHVLNKTDADLDIKTKIGWMVIWLATSNLVIILLANLQLDKLILFCDKRFNPKKFMIDVISVRKKKKKIIRPRRKRVLSQMQK